MSCDSLQNPRLVRVSNDKTVVVNDSFTFFIHKTLATLTVLFEKWRHHIKCGACSSRTLKPESELEKQYKVCTIQSSCSTLKLFEDTVVVSYRTKSIPSKAGCKSEADWALFQTASFPMQTPCSLAPISAPHIHEGLLRTTSYVSLTWSMSM